MNCTIQTIYDYMACKLLFAFIFRGFVFSSVPVRTDLGIRADKYEKKQKTIMIILFYIEIMII